LEAAVLFMSLTFTEASLSEIMHEVAEVDKATNLLHRNNTHARAPAQAAKPLHLLPLRS
jgi:hypothetical protein